MLIAGETSSGQSWRDRVVDLRVDDLAATHACLAMLGARPTDPQDAPTGRYITFTDPDGYRANAFEKRSG